MLSNEPKQRLKCFKSQILVEFWIPISVNFQTSSKKRIIVACRKIISEQFLQIQVALAPIDKLDNLKILRRLKCSIQLHKIAGSREIMYDTEFPSFIAIPKECLVHRMIVRESIYVVWGDSVRPSIDVRVQC